MTTRNANCYWTNKMEEPRAGLYRTHRVSRMMTLRGGSTSCYSDERVFDFLQPEVDLAAMASACREPEAIARACGITSATNTDGKNKAECAVYVFGVEGEQVSKIGISHCPIQRLAGLQACHWAGLYLHAVLWSPTRKAETIEQTALQAADEMGVRLRGEWVGMLPDEAFETVLKAARYARVPVCDSAAWLSNYRLRLDSMAANYRLLKNKREVRFSNAA